jgi:hypothetical protein
MEIMLAAARLRQVGRLRRAILHQITQAAIIMAVLTPLLADNKPPPASLVRAAQVERSVVEWFRQD